MPRHRLYFPGTIVPHQGLRIEGEQAHYLTRVLRLRPGDEVLLFDGSGAEFPATVRELRRQHAELLAGAGTVRDLESPLAIRLIQGISRGERMDFVVQKATELGVGRISPVQTALSVVRLDSDRSRRRHEHWSRVAQSACEQCGRTRVPALDDVRDLADCLRQPTAAELRLLLDPAAGTGLDGHDRPRSVELLIGPEGGLTDPERELARSSGFEPLRLGPRILRTETAAVAAISVLQARWGDLQA